MSKDFNLYVFVDESGSTNLVDQKGGSRFYVTSAIIVNGDSIEELISSIDAISNDFNGGKPLKSSKIAGNINRRLSLLRRLVVLPFRYIALAVDKSKINRESGLRYTQVFYKNVNRRLYEIISKNAIGEVRVIADTYGSCEYQKSAFKYFEEQGSLFNPIKFRAVDDENQRLVQLADIMSGSLRIWLSSIPVKDEHHKELKDLLYRKLKFLHCWPIIYSEPRTICLNSEYNEDDEKIESVMVEKACALIEEYENSDDDDDIRKSEVLKYLIEARSLDGYVYCDKLIDIVNRRCEKKIQRKAFLSNIIGSIRKEGLIITGTHKGYRLATTVNDIRAYLQQDKTVILPMLTKLRCARQLLLSAVNIDILAGEENKELLACQTGLETIRVNEFVSNDEIDDEKVLPK